ncbi:erythromycin esterase [Streptomyces albus subsp. albus]|nr:erythromycin esterase [Streptomyces albus subsp. albus]
MTASSVRRRTADWFRTHTRPLATLDADAPLDDLEPLRDLIGDARVVAIGEGAHFVAEFTQVRRRLIRFLAERCGFRVLAFEFGFAEAFPLDRWLRGEGADPDLAGMAGTTGSGLTGDLARWLRRHNNTSGSPLRLVGLDTPDAGGTLRPALEPVRRYLAEVDPELEPAVRRALAIADRVAGRSAAVAAPRWSRLDPADQTALTAVLSRIATRFRALEPLYVQRGDRPRYDLAVQHLRAAVHADYMFSAMHDLFSGKGLSGDPSARERFMADSFLWHLRRCAPGERVLLVAHNNHIQKTPFSFDGALVALPLGSYLDQSLGEDYRALALTHTADSVPEMYPDESAELGFEVNSTVLGAPTPGSPEGALLDAGFGAVASCVDLRPLRHDRAGEVLLDRIRTQSVELAVPVPEAFDGLVCVPTATAHVETALR